jgi:hypothetical protein
MAFHNAGNTIELKISGVDEAFSVDVPLRCGQQTLWVHAGAGDNSFDIPPGAKNCELPKQTDYLYRL